VWLRARYAGMARELVPGPPCSAIFLHRPAGRSRRRPGTRRPRPPRALPGGAGRITWKICIEELFPEVPNNMFSIFFCRKVQQHSRALYVLYVQNCNTDIQKRYQNYHAKILFFAWLDMFPLSKQLFIIKKTILHICNGPESYPGSSLIVEKLL
jgi:hypothetical protein